MALQADPPTSTGTARVLRPADLVGFRASWTGLTLTGQGPPRLVAGAQGGSLVIAFDSQHVAELASPDNTPAPPSPVPARAANPSRLVFKVPAGGTIDFTIEGVLAAMGGLELAVAPIARPAPAPSIVLPLGPSAGPRSIVGRLLGAASGSGIVRASLDPAGAARGGLVATQQALMAARRIVATGATATLSQAAGLVSTLPPVVPVPSAMPARPQPGETAIEAPFRLILSPSARGGWAHATLPATDEPGGTRIELWHSRLAVRDDDGTLDEIGTAQRVVRAIWTRDREMPAPNDPLGPRSIPTAFHRDRLVGQTAGSDKAPTVAPPPAQVRRLALSSLGAWVDLFVKFPEPSAYPPAFGLSLASWEQVSPMGRDQYVRIDTPGALWPPGHSATLVTIMYRKVVGATRPQAALFTRQYIVLGAPVRSFARIDLPFVSARVGPIKTPDLNLVPGTAPFWPTPVGAGEPLRWAVDGSDHEGRVVHLSTPLLFVPAKTTQATVEAFLAAQPAAAQAPWLSPDAAGQTVAFAPPAAPDQATPGTPQSAGVVETGLIHWWGEVHGDGIEPFLKSAEVVVPAMRRLTPTAPPVTVGYPDVYKAHGFDAANAGNVFLQLATPVTLGFGASDRSGGFVQPDTLVAGLARSTGIVADVDAAAAGTFDPATLFNTASLPKLFGLFPLATLIEGGPLALAPKFVTEELNRIAGLLRDLEQLEAALADAGAAVATFRDAVAAQVQKLEAALPDLLDAAKSAAATSDLGAALTGLGTQVQLLRQAIPTLGLGPFDRAQLDRLVAALAPVEALLADAGALAGTIADVLAFVGGLNPGGGEFRARMEWRPHLKTAIPSGTPILTFDRPDALRLVIEARASLAHAVGLDVSAEIDDFHLILLPGASLMKLDFKRLSFRSSSGRKPEIDLVFGGITFLGILSFINVLEKLIPLDGFSDPPFLDVSADGISAGFTVALPNLAVGVFSLSNISLGADARVPFLGESISVGFNFCTRDRPFTLGVFPLGGGGFVGLRATPDGLSLLEISLEFGALVALDFGVASGSVSAMGGIYLRLEDKAGSLTGFFRIRGEVDVLSLITASIELYMALTYAFDTGKMVGEATITVSVSVLFFSTSVSVHAQRTFAGSNGDPTARQMLQTVDGGTTVWDAYCNAFAS